MRSVELFAMGISQATSLSATRKRTEGIFVFDESEVKPSGELRLGKLKALLFTQRRFVAHSAEPRHSAELQAIAVLFNDSWIQN